MRNEKLKGIKGEREHAMDGYTGLIKELPKKMGEGRGHYIRGLEFKTQWLFLTHSFLGE